MRKALDTGIEYLSATKIGGSHYRYFDHASGHYWVSDESDVEDLGQRMLDYREAVEMGQVEDDDPLGESSVFSTWCSDTDSHKVR